MKKAVLNRIIESDKQTLGVFSVVEDDNFLFMCKTLELPDKNNASNISCIPPGEYECEWTYSNAFKREMYEVKGVPNRAGIRIHPANYARQLRGCIALGAAHKDIDSDGQLDVIHSGDTLKQFETIMNKEKFKLVIK